MAQAGFDEGAIALYGRCDEEVGVPYQPFAEALDWYTGHVGQPVLGRYPGELRRLQPLLGSRLAGLAAPVSSDPRSEEYLLFEAARSWLVELSRQQPVVLVLDDLHWASRPVLLLLRHVLRAAVAEGDGVRLLVLGTYRDTELGRNHALAGAMADVRRLPGVEQLPLAGLSVVEVAELVSQTAGHALDDDGRRLTESLHAETEGNPFFVGEVLRHLVETGTVRRQANRWVVARGGTMAVPEGVRDVVGRRLGRLSAQTSQMLSVAAVLGRDFDVELLAALRDAPEGSLLDALDEALGAGLVQETGADRYRFAHVLVRATLLEELQRLAGGVSTGGWAKRPRSCDPTMSWHSPTTSARRAPTAKGCPERCATAWPQPNRPSTPEPWATPRRASARSWDCWTIPPPMRLEHASRRCAAWEKRTRPGKRGVPDDPS